MTSSSEIVDVLDGSFRAAGLSGRGKRWTARFEEVAWIVQLDSLRGGDQGLDVGLWFPPAAESIPGRAAECPVVVHVENLPLGFDRSLVIRCMAANGGGLSPVERTAALQEIVAALGAFIVSRGTRAAVVEAYRRGDLRSAFIHMDVRHQIFETS